MTFRNGQKIICVDADQAPMLTLSHIYTAQHYCPPSQCVWKGVAGKWPTVWLYEVEPLPGCHGFCAVFEEMLDKKPVYVAEDGTEWQVVKV